MPIHVRSGYRAYDFPSIRWLLLPGMEPDRGSDQRIETIVHLTKRLWQVSGYIGSKAAPYLTASRVDQELLDYFRAVHELSNLQSESILEVSSLLGNAGYEYILLKGAATLVSYYEISERILGDIDIGVHPLMAREAHRYLRGRNFVQCGYDKARRAYVELSDEEARRQEAGHHELCMLVRESKLSAEQGAKFLRCGSHLELLAPMIRVVGTDVYYVEEIDIHHGIFSNISCDLMIDRRQVSIFRGSAVNLPGKVDHFVHVLMKLYWEGVRSYWKGAHQFCDLFRVASRLSSDEWSDVHDLLRKYNMLHAGYYVVRRLVAQGVAVPAGSLDRIGCEASLRWADPESANDFGDFWEKIWWLGA